MSLHVSRIGATQMLPAMLPWWMRNIKVPCSFCAKVVIHLVHSAQRDLIVTHLHQHLCRQMQKWCVSEGLQCRQLTFDILVVAQQNLDILSAMANLHSLHAACRCRDFP